MIKIFPKSSPKLDLKEIQEINGIYEKNSLSKIPFPLKSITQNEILIISNNTSKMNDIIDRQKKALQKIIICFFFRKTKKEIENEKKTKNLIEKINLIEIEKEKCEKEKQELTKKSNLLDYKVKHAEAIIDRLSKEKNELEKEKNELENEKNELPSNLFEIGNETNVMNVDKNKNFEIINQLKEQISINEEKIKFAEQTQAMFKVRSENKYKKLKNKYLKKKEELEESQNILIEKKEQFAKKQEELKIKYEKNRNELKALKKQISNINPSNLDNFDSYDLTININSLNNENSKTQKAGWEIKASKVFQNFIDKERTIIGIIGHKNKGKTFLLNEVFGMNLPHGFCNSTKGISCKVQDNLNALFLDTKGLDAPACFFENETNEKKTLTEGEKREKINDNFLTDIFLQDFILEVCEMIIIVINQLTLTEQKFIERVALRYKSKKMIMIVHNYQNIYDAAEINKQLKNDVEHCFEIKATRSISSTNGNKEGFEYIEKSRLNNQENIIHVVMGPKFSNAGDYFNEMAIEDIKKYVVTRTEKVKFDIFKNLSDFLSENYYFYMKFPKSPKEAPSLYLENDYLLIKTNQKYKVSRSEFNALAPIINPPPYQVLCKGNKINCFIEIPTLEKESLQLQIEKIAFNLNCLIIKGFKKNEEIINCKNMENVGGRLISGEFETRIPLGENFLEMKNKGWKLNNGILCVEIEITENEEEKILCKK